MSIQKFETNDCINARQAYSTPGKVYIPADPNEPVERPLYLYGQEVLPCESGFGD